MAEGIGSILFLGLFFAVCAALIKPLECLLPHEIGGFRLFGEEEEETEEE